MNGRAETLEGHSWGERPCEAMSWDAGLSTVLGREFNNLGLRQLIVTDSM